MRSDVSLWGFPSVTFKTVPECPSDLTVALSRPFRNSHPALPHSAGWLGVKKQNQVTYLLTSHFALLYSGRSMVSLLGVHSACLLYTLSFFVFVFLLHGCYFPFKSECVPFALFQHKVDEDDITWPNEADQLVCFIYFRFLFCFVFCFCFWLSGCYFPFKSACVPFALYQHKVDEDDITWLNGTSHLAHSIMITWREFSYD